MTHEHIFGYGSLVNKSTHKYGDLQPATLQGWRREWHYTSLRNIAYLSVSPDANSSIQGVILASPTGDAALSDRERHYDRLDVSNLVTPGNGSNGPINVFAIPPQVHSTPGPDAVLLLSYIDVVVQGYFQTFGTGGAKAFFSTTNGWHAPVVNDRANPQYPRHQSLNAAQTRLVDDGLDALNVVVVQT